MKKLKKYIFDFIILFISISAAFYAENFRQTLADKDDLNKFLNGLKNDLKTDSLIYLNVIGEIDKSLSSIDSLLLISDDDKVDRSVKIRYLAISLLLIFDVGIDNNVNYNSLINSGHLKLIDDIDYKNSLRFYYRNKDVWLKNYANEFQFFRTFEVYPYLNSHVDFQDFEWNKGLKISKAINTNPEIFKKPELKNYLLRTRQFYLDLKSSLQAYKKWNFELMVETKNKLK